MKKYWGFLAFVILLVPLVFSIDTFTYEETDKVAISVNAEDEDNDALSYGYEDPLDENGEWQTTYGDAGEYNVEITVSDGVGEDSQEILIIVNKKEAPPEIKSFKPNRDVVTISENEDITFEVDVFDPNNDEISYSWGLNENFMTADEKYTFGTGYESAGKHKVLVTVSDGKNEAQKEWEVDVEDINTKPKFERIPTRTIKENEEVVINLNAEDPDGDSIIFSSDNLPEGSSLDGNIFRWKTDFDTIKAEDLSSIFLQKFRILSKTYRVRFFATGRNVSTQRVASITVNNVNRGPELEDLEDIEVNEGESFSVDAKGNDPDGDKLEITYSGWIDSNSYTPGYDEQGEYYVKVKVSDGDQEVSDFVKVTVNDVNRGPVLKDIPGVILFEGDELAIELEGEDVDGNFLEYSLMNDISDYSLEGNLFKWVPNHDISSGDNEILEFEFKVSDGVDEDIKTVNIEVIDKNRVPEIINSSEKVEVKVNEPLLLNVDVVDLDGDELSYRWQFGFFENYETGGKHKRIFTSKGDKKVKVIVSDGFESVEKEWEIKVV